MDAGWWRTFEGYYDTEVKHIFESVFDKLEANPKYIYTLGDIAFFRHYYLSQNMNGKKKIYRLVNNGQIDIVHGGMVSSDEACPNYNDMIRNFEMGHSWLWEEFGVTPTIGWQLDPFGHSAANAHIFAELGFDAFVFTRINEDE